MSASTPARSKRAGHPSFSTFIREEYGGHFAGDLTGGLTAAVVALPLALAFAIASGVPAKYGLYTAIVTGIVAAIFGGSKVQISGPTGGMAAVLIAVTTQYGYEKVILIGFIAGLMQIATGVFKLGRFVRMLPFPLIAGFTTGIAIIILGGQIDNALGVPVSHKATEFYDRIVETVSFAGANGVNSRCLLLAGIVIAAMLSLGRVSSRIPAAMVGIVLASAVAAYFQFDVPMIHDIPRSLPQPHFPAFSWEMFRGLLRPAATIAALGAIESLLAAIVADGILADGTRHDPNRELFGQGMANIAGSFFGGIPCTGAIARTAVNVKSGGRTRLASIIHSLALLAIMVFFAPWATQIPIAALAGVLMMTSVRMVEWHQISWLMKAPRSDIAVFLVTVLLTVFTDLVTAVEFGLVTAGILFINKMTKIQPLDVTDTIRADSRGSQQKIVRTFRIPGPLFWGDSHALTEALEHCENTHVIILKMQLVSMIDASGMAALREAKQRLDKKGIRLLFASTPSDTFHTLSQMGLTEELGASSFFSSLEEAKKAADQP